jgi:hypothetical protein
MRRLHLFEFLDQAWLPDWLRIPMLSYLSVVNSATSLPSIWADHIAALVEPGETVRIIDLASGAGGPLHVICKDLQSRGYRVDVVLTDLYPVGVKAGHGSLRYWPEPVDARCVPKELEGIRTMFTAIHHFHPDAARAIFVDAFERRQPLCVFESTSRSMTSVLGALLIPAVVLLAMPWVRPLTWCTLLCTYAAPVLPLVVFWDALVSQVRSYSLAELRGFICDLKSADYWWETGSIKVPGLPVAFTFVIGHPVRRN